jgi:hypothetical protein
LPAVAAAPAAPAPAADAQLQLPDQAAPACDEALPEAEWLARPGNPPQDCSDCGTCDGCLCVECTWLCFGGTCSCDKTWVYVCGP